MTMLGISFRDNKFLACYHEGQQVMPVEGPTIEGVVFPSYVEFDKAGELLYVGKKAYDDYLAGIPNPVIWGAEMLLGLSYTGAQRELRHLDYTIERAEDGSIIIPVGSHLYTPVDIVTTMLNKIKQDAIRDEVTTIDRVVVSHPAYFDSVRLNRILQAARQAFSESAIDLMPEPVAAALGYGLEIAPGTSTTVCVIDFGAAYLGIVTDVFRYRAGQVVMSSEPCIGRASLGGIDITDLLLDQIIKENGLTQFDRMRRERYAKNAEDIRLHSELRTLRSELELIKIRLSHPKMKSQALQAATYNGEPIDATFTREKIEELLDTPLPLERAKEFFGYDSDAEQMAQMLQALAQCHPGERRGSLSFLDVLRLTIMNALSKDGFKSADIDTLILVGESASIIFILKALREIFAENSSVMAQLHKMEQENYDAVADRILWCVTRGAASYKIPPQMSDFCYAIVKEQIEWQDGTTYLIYHDNLLIQRGEQVPVKKSIDLEIRRSGETLQIPIGLLEGQRDLAISDRNAKLWRRSAPLFFEPACDRENMAHFTISLELDRDEIAAITVHDKVANKTHSFRELPMVEELERKRYRVVSEKEWTEIVRMRQLTREEITEKKTWLKEGLYWEPLDLSRNSSMKDIVIRIAELSHAASGDQELISLLHRARMHFVTGNYPAARAIWEKLRPQLSDAHLKPILGIEEERFSRETVWQDDFGNNLEGSWAEVEKNIRDRLTSRFRRVAVKLANETLEQVKAHRVDLSKAIKTIEKSVYYLKLARPFTDNIQDIDEQLNVANKALQELKRLATLTGQSVPFWPETPVIAPPIHKPVEQKKPAPAPKETAKPRPAPPPKPKEPPPAKKEVPPVKVEKPARVKPAPVATRPRAPAKPSGSEPRPRRGRLVAAIVVALIVIAGVVIGIQFLGSSDKSVTAPGKPNEKVEKPPAAAEKPAVIPGNPPVELDKPTLVFQDDFSNPNSGWDVTPERSGDSAYENGEYSVEVKGFTNWWHADSNEKSVGQQGDFIVEVDARKISAEASDASCILVFRYQGQGGDYYSLQVNSKGEYSLKKKFHGIMSPLNENPAKLAWTYSSYIKADSNKIKVVCHGPQIEVYVNNQKLTAVVDTSLASGRILLGAHSGSGSNAHYHFDNFRLYKLSPSPSSSQPPQTSISPKAQIEDDFINTSSGWTVVKNENGEWSYENGEYSVYVEKTNWVIWGTNRWIINPADFTVEVDVRKMSPLQGEGTGLIFRCQKDGDRYNGYYFRIWPSATAGSGTYSLQKLFQGNTYVLKSAGSPYIKTGYESNRLKVVCQGSQIEVYVNGYKLDTITDTSFTTGNVGLAASSEPFTTGSHFHFDNFKLHVSK